MHIRLVINKKLIGDLCTAMPLCDEMIQVCAILGHGLLDGVSWMVEGLPFTIADDRVGVGREMLVFMEPSMNVGPKCCVLLLYVMDRIKANGQPCITQTARPPAC